VEPVEMHDDEFGAVLRTQPVRHRVALPTTKIVESRDTLGSARTPRHAHCRDGEQVGSFLDEQFHRRSAVHPMRPVIDLVVEHLTCRIQVGEAL
jgi:hypothetical protein